MYWGGRNDHHKNRVTKFFLASCSLVLAISVQKVRPDDSVGYGLDEAALSNNCQLDNVLASLLKPDELGSIQVQALRRELLRILNNQALNDNLELPDYDLLSDGKLLYDEPVNDKRSIASLARTGQLPIDFKRNLGALARSGYFTNNAYSKRSIATLAKNGQLPTLQSPEEETETDAEEQKRGIESLARSGAISRFLKRGIESLARSGYIPGKRYNYYGMDDKRNIGSLARNGYMKREVDNFLENLYQKRYVGSLARQYTLPSGKRNVGALARNGELYRFNRNQYDDNASDKRNIQSLMRYGGSSYGKRNIASLARNQNPLYSRLEEYKRNIGSMARDWALPNQSTAGSEHEEDKRNVAALLRQDSYLHSMNRNSAVDAYPTPENGEENQYENKRSLASLKAQATSNYLNYGNKNVKRSAEEHKDEGAEKAAARPEHGRSKRQADYALGLSKEYPIPDREYADDDFEELYDALVGVNRLPSNEKRFLGNIPLSRMAELGKISMMGQAASGPPPTSPAYRRRQYLLSRAQPSA